MRLTLRGITCLPLFIVGLVAASNATAAQPPLLTLPSSVTGTVSQLPAGGTVGADYSTINLTSGQSGALNGITYNVWCMDPYGYIMPSSVTFQVYSSYAIPSSVSNAGTVQEWQEINYLLNHKTGTSGTLTTSALDVQQVIWNILVPGYGFGGSNPPYYVTSDAQTLYNDITTNGIGFVPGPGQNVAILLYTSPGVESQSAISGTPTQSMFIEYTIPAPSSITLTKTANTSQCKPFDKVTYSYFVKNTGGVSLTSIKVVDDNGTPNYAKDDFTVGTIASLAPGASATLTATVYLPVKEMDTSWGTTATGGTLIPKVLPNGNIQVTYLEDSDNNDNTFGNAAAADWGSNGHTFTDLDGDSAEFQFTNAWGLVVSDVKCNYIGKTSSKPSGWSAQATAPNNWWGSWNSWTVASVSSSLSDALNASPDNYGYTHNSPWWGNTNWNYEHSYTVEINASAFSWVGFSGCNIAVVNSGKCKSGVNGYKPAPVCSTVTNTATVTASSTDGAIVSAVAKASVTVGSQCQAQVPPCPKKQPQCWEQSWRNQCKQQNWQKCNW